MFVFLSGSKPGADFLQDQVPLDADGFMIMDSSMQSPVAGVFGAGEVLACDGHWRRQNFWS
ncbi:hypothetical protein [Paenibacillus sp. Soil787]|uniref:hypothetical protein n=1 Tax=Paenibacillus sp. Soil787 TaxID=1736411 RepID=UPI001F2028BE|nr:hypothetical protein [Paenibacillus sp. Soil787]